MGTNAEHVADWIARDEGGIADVGDGKGTTYFGQTRGWLDQWGLPTPHSVEQAKANTVLWLAKSGLQAFVDRDRVLGHIVATFAFHAGEATAVKAFQRRMRCAVDGVIGPETRGALQMYGYHGLRVVMVAEYTRHLMHLLSSRKVDRRKWARGWGDRAARLIDSVVP